MYFANCTPEMYSVKYFIRNLYSGTLLQSTSGCKMPKDTLK